MRVPSPSIDSARMSAINVCPGGDLNVIAGCRLACLVAAPLWALTAGSALAVDQVHDEIQVYNANINDVGQWSYEQHLNFAVIGQKQPEFPGGFTSNRSLQGTPEFAYGITNWWEVGFYLPFGVSGSGEFLSNGAKLRSLFAVPDAGKRNFFYGVNFELSYEMPQFAPTPWNMEIRPIIGVRNKEWEFIINPIVDIGFGPGGEADFAPAARLAQRFHRRLLQRRLPADLAPDEEFRGQRQLVVTAEAGGKLPVGCPAWHDRAVVVPVVPVAADSVTPSAHVWLSRRRTFWAPSRPGSFCGS
jgi:hypothetical protein